MKRIATVCALCALWGCRVSDAPEMVGIALSYATSEQSKTDVLAQEDEIGVFAAIEGTENYFLENTKYSVGLDGRSLSTTPAAYYPDAKQAVTFTAYLPFGGTWSGTVGTFSVPTDQTNSLKQADLCWATASSTPAKTAVPLEFAHKMARLLVTTNTPTDKITIPNAFSGGTLNIKTGAFTNTLRSEVFTTGNELILPAQTLSRLVLTVSGVEYVFAPVTPITLTEGHTTSLSLTLNLNPMQKTATLSGSSTTNWIGSATQGNPTQAAVNTLTIHWPKCHPQSELVDEVVFRIKDQATNTTADYTVSSGIAYADQAFTVSFASTAVFYPYTIEDITLYRSGVWLHESSNIVGGAMVKRGACVVGVRQPLNPPAEGDYVEIDMGGNKKLKWAKGNLVAINEHNAKVGKPADGGLYFQFGSLIGYKGGAVANGGTGVGSNPYTGDYYSWNSATSFSWANEAMVWPSNLSGNPGTVWPQLTSGTTHKWYFSGNGVTSGTIDVTDATQGVGDPCTYYLGAPWRLPTTNEYVAMCNNKSGINSRYSWVDAGGTWVPGSGGNLQGTKLFFPASGGRHTLTGLFNQVTTLGACWSSSVGGFRTGLYLNFGSSWVTPQYNISYRSNGFSVRCVAD